MSDIDIHAARRARAAAFVRQELKKGREWASLTYEYDKGEDDAKDGQDTSEERADRPVAPPDTEG
jgi:hypothetical protein